MGALAVLIVDDSEMNRWLLAEQMQYWTDNVSLAGDGEEAWCLLQQNRYSLVFIDVNMPVMNGYELIKKIRADSAYQSIPMVAITAHVQSQCRHLLIEEGFNDCLIKPIVLADVQRVITQWCMPTNGSGSEYYVDTLLEKVDHNRKLGRLFLQKLFVEVPKQLTGLEQALNNQEIQQAWEIAHKLHGTFCFYGYENFRELAGGLEQSLLAVDMPKAMHEFQDISAKFSDLESMKPKLESQLAE